MLWLEDCENTYPGFSQLFEKVNNLPKTCHDKSMQRDSFFRAPSECIMNHEFTHHTHQVKLYTYNDAFPSGI